MADFDPALRRVFCWEPGNTNRHIEWIKENKLLKATYVIAAKMTRNNIQRCIEAVENALILHRTEPFIAI